MAHFVLHKQLRRSSNRLIPLLVVLAFIGTLVFISGQRLTFADSSSDIAGAISWAENEMKNNPTAYYGLCLPFVEDAYQKGGGININDDHAPNPVQYWNDHKSLQHYVDTNAPAGALVIWGADPSSSDGHIALSLGGGWVISSAERSYNYIHEFTIADRNNAGYASYYLGWMSPPGVNVSLTGAPTSMMIPGNWSGDGRQDFAYITRHTTDGGFDVAVWEQTNSGIVWKGVWWSVNGASGVRYDNTVFIPADMDGSGRLSLYYATSTNWDNPGFSLALMHNNGNGGFDYWGQKWNPASIKLSETKFLPGKWSANGNAAFAYVTKNDGDGGFTVADFATINGNLVWQGTKWTSPGSSSAFDTTAFVPANMDGGYTSLYYATSTNWANPGFTMGLMHNDGQNNFVWRGSVWTPSGLKLNETTFIPGYWTGGNQEGFAYVTKRESSGGFDLAVFQPTTSGLQWKGVWWSTDSLPYDAIKFIPSDMDSDGYTDLFYATPNSTGLDCALMHNSTGSGLNWVGEQWNPTNPSLANVTFL